MVCLQLDGFQRLCTDSPLRRIDDALDGKILVHRLGILFIKGSQQTQIA